MNNPTFFQFFHWYYPDNGELWDHCAEQSAHLSSLGITHVLLPPAYKSGRGTYEPGYAVYDLYDLGEFDQKGTVRTRHGTKDQYLACIETLHKNGLAAIADIVLNHKHGGDETEKMTAREVDRDNRNIISDHTTEIEAHTRYIFPGRKNTYSDYVWDKNSFSGVSEMMDNEERIFLIEHEHTNNHWNEMMDDEMGNFDYLMGADIEFRNDHVREELKRWGKWYVETTGVDGFRLDAVKHINWRFYEEWLGFLKETFQKDFFVIAEYWSSKPEPITNYCKALHEQCLMYDVPLHYHFSEASYQGKHYDMRKLLDDTVIRQMPQHVFTFVDNHDSQPFQSLESYVDFWFQPLAYAIILLRIDGVPCIFYPAIYGGSYDEKKGEETIHINLAPVPGLENMIKARTSLAYGEQYDYFDHPNTVGWVRKGIAEKPGSGLVVLMSNGSDGDKEMDLGQENANKVFIDLSGNRAEKITTDNDGKARFFCNGGSVSIWVKAEVMDNW